jgi:protein-disulfide isomerase
MTMTRTTTPSTAPDTTRAAAGRLRRDVTNLDHSRGPVDAEVTLVEYGDYQCPYCRQAQPLVKALQRRLGDSGRPFRFVFRNFPLTEIHPRALHAAEAAESVAAHGGEAAFWAMHDTIFEHQRDSAIALSDQHLAEYAAAVGVDGARVARDLENGVHEARVRDDVMGGIRSGVNGTPTFFINGLRFDDDWTDADAFARALEDAAAGARASGR